MKLFRLNSSLNHPDRKDFARNNATAMWRATDAVEGSNYLPDATGNGHDARFGSTEGADTNDPLILPHDGDNYLYIPGVGGDTVNIDNVGFGAGTGYRFEIDMERTSDVAGWARLVAHGWNNRFLIYINYTNGNVNLYCGHSNGHGAVTVICPVREGLGRYKFAVELHVYQNQLYGFCYNWTEAEWELYHQGQSVVNANDYNMGPRSAIDFRYHTTGVSPRDHKLYSFKYYNLDENYNVANLVARFDANEFEEPHIQQEFSVDNGSVVADINRPTSGRKSVLVDRPILLFGTDDYLEVPHYFSFELEPYSIVFMYRGYDPTGVTRLIASRSSVTAGGSGFTLRGGANDGRQVFFSNDNFQRVLPGLLDDGTTQTLAVIRNSEELSLHRNSDSNVSINSNNSAPIVSENNLFIGGWGSAGNIDMEFIGAAIFKGKALTDLELNWVAKEIASSQTNRQDDL